MVYPRPRGSNLFGGLVLLLIGTLLLLHNYRGLEVGHFFRGWWPLFLILWGVVKLFERTIGARSLGPGAGRLRAGEILLVLGLLGFMGMVIVVETVRNRFGDEVENPWSRPNFAFDLDVAPQPIPADARIDIHAGRGDITVHASDEPEIRVSGKKNVQAWDETRAQRAAERISVEIAKNGDAYEIRPSGMGHGDSHMSVNMDIAVPKASAITIRTEKGDITVADMRASVTITRLYGDLEVRNTAGDVSVDMRHGSIKIADTQGDVSISGRGESIEAVNVTGGLTMNGNFVGPIRAEKISKGVRFVSHRTDLTLTHLSGHLEATSGNLEVIDAPGNLEIRSRNEDIVIENAGGKVRVDDSNGNIQVRYLSPPKDDVEINNASAGITLALPESSDFEMVADCRSCDVDTEFEGSAIKKTSSPSGDTHLEGKVGSGRGPKISLKTTYGSISIRRLSGYSPAPPRHPAPPGRIPHLPRSEEQ